MPASRSRSRRPALSLAAIRPVPADAAAAAEPGDWSDPAVLGDWAVAGGPLRAQGGGGGGGGSSSDAESNDESEPRRNHMTGGRAKGSSVPPGPEEKVCVVHPAMFRAHPGRYLLLVLLFVGGIAALITGFVKQDPYGWLRYLGAPALLASVIWWFWWWFFSTVCVKLEITNKRSIRQEGFVRRSSTEVLHDHVRSVDITQSVMQRMLNVGYIGIDSAGQDGIEIEIGDIPRPYDVKAIIDRYRRM